MKPGFVISGCADAAVVTPAEGESVISVSSSAKEIEAETDIPCVDGSIPDQTLSSDNSHILL